MNRLREERDQGLNTMIDGQILEEAIGSGKHGYLQGYGLGKTVTDYHGVKPSRLDLARQVLDIEQKANERIEEARKLLDEVTQEFEKKLEASMQSFDEKLDANNKMREERIMKMREELGPARSMD